MSLVKSVAVGLGDMFYIQHESDNFTIIDCSLPEGRAEGILDEINDARRGKTIVRFISTHPDQDHIAGLTRLDDRIEIRNFYCVENKATKPDMTEDFRRYVALRDDSKKSFSIQQECRRKWMNESSEERGSAGISILWPVTTNDHYRAALAEAEAGGRANNISAIIKYSLKNGVTMLWMGDLETDFMEDVSTSFTPGAADVLFAPHHGRESGRVPSAWLKAVSPQLIVVGEAPAEDLCYYEDYGCITQNSCGDITFECLEEATHVFVSEREYTTNCLHNRGQNDRHGYYIGSLSH